MSATCIARIVDTRQQGRQDKVEDKQDQCRDCRGHDIVQVPLRVGGMNQSSEELGEKCYACCRGRWARGGGIGNGDWDGHSITRDTTLR